MKKNILKATRLMIGYLIYGIGTALTVKADLGLAPWGVFNQGLSNQFGFSFGVSNQVVGAAILILDLLLNERIGWATLGNIYFIGLFYDLIDQSNIIPIFDSIPAKFGMMIFGMMLISLATFLYLSAQLGTGPRDGLMIALTKRIKLPVGVIRSSIEITALIIGYFMGGKVGWGTLIMSLGLGFFIQSTFTLFKFDVRQVSYRYINDDISYIVNKMRNKQEIE